MRAWRGILCLCVWAAVQPAFAESIVHSKHNLSVSGPGSVKASGESEICIFCHTPHQASGEAPLWNRYQSAQAYIPYTSSTALASPGQPTGASKLCLSCHDGTVALGLVTSRSSTIPFQGGIRVMPYGNGRLDTDLSDDHPISFHYDASLANQNGELKNPSFLTGAVRLDRSGQLQCTTCHDPHDNTYGNFLVTSNAYSNLCTTCHQETGWSSSAHSSTSAGCLGCHSTHGAGQSERLLRSPTMEGICFDCHSGVESDFNKASRHPLGSVECADCHDPHQANSGNPLEGVGGISRTGVPVSQVSHEYELCFRCHGDSQQGFAYVSRQYPETNTRREFDPSNASYHPVISTGKNPNVPSLISPYSTGSRIDCSDCHSPHGSNNSPLLERNLTFSDFQTENSSTYALCYKCHDRNSIMRDESFPYHHRHTAKEDIPCSACHDPHGVSANQHLINFDRSIVSPNDSGVIAYVDLGTFAGKCYVSCHKKNHGPLSYGVGEN